MAYRISELTAGTPPYLGTALIELSIVNGAMPSGYESRKALLSDITGAVGDGLTLTDATLSGTTTLPGGGAIAANGWIGIDGAAPPSAPLDIGNRNITGAQPCILLQRILDDTNGAGLSGHGITNSESFARDNSAYAAFDAANLYTGTFAFLNHYVGFQSRPNIATVGTVGRVAGFDSEINGNIAGNHINTMQHYYVKGDDQYFGTMDNQFGLYVIELTKATNNYGVYVFKNKSYFSGMTISDTGTVLLPNGSLAGPLSVAFTTEPDIGFYQDSLGWKFVYDGADRLGIKDGVAIENKDVDMFLDVRSYNNAGVYNNAVITFATPRNSSAAGTTLSRRGYIVCTGNAADNTGSLFLGAAASAGVTTGNDAAIQANTSVMQVYSSGRVDFWRSGVNFARLDGQGVAGGSFINGSTTLATAVVSGTATIATAGVTGTATIATLALTGSATLPGIGAITAAGELGLGIAAPTARLHLGGTYTTANPQMARVFGTLASSTTATQTGMEMRVTYTPSGASLSTVHNFNSNPTLNAGALTVATFTCFQADVTLSAGYSGALTNFAGFMATDPNISGSGTINNVRQFYALAVTVSNGATSGTRTNRQFHAAGITAGSGGATVSNRGVEITVPSGGATAGTATNRGLYITGNGGTAAGGTVVNAAIHSDSTAASYLSGPLSYRPRAVTGALPTNGDFEIEATSNTTLTLRYRGSDGATRSAAITLA